MQPKCTETAEYWIINSNTFSTYCHENIYLMGLIFARTNFRELENFVFREDLFSRMSCFTIFREDLLSRIGYAENFREH